MGPKRRAAAASAPNKGPEKKSAAAKEVPCAESTVRTSRRLAIKKEVRAGKRGREEEQEGQEKAENTQKRGRREVHEDKENKEESTDKKTKRNQEEDRKESTKERGRRENSNKAKKKTKKQKLEEEEETPAPTPPPSPPRKSPPAANATKLLPRQLSPMRRPPSCADVYDPATYGEEEFGPEPEVKKKRRKVNRKRRADIVLTFGAETKEAAVPKLKEIKNLKTPRPAAPVPRGPAAKVPPCVVPYVPPPRTANSPAGFSRDCDDFLPSFDGPDPVDDDFPASSSIPRVSVEHSRPNQSPPALPERLSEESDGGNGDGGNHLLLPARYKTPAVPRKVRKIEGKVSTPRLVDPTTAEQPKLSTKELVRNCFGFDDSSEESEGENDSLVGGISPVRGSGGVVQHPDMTSASRTSFQSSSLSALASTRLSNFDSTRGVGGGGCYRTVELDGPSRFEIAVARAPGAGNKSRVASQALKSSLAARKAAAERDQRAARAAAAVKVQDKKSPAKVPKTEEAEGGRRRSPRKAQQAVEPEKEKVSAVQEAEETDSQDTTDEDARSLYEECESEEDEKENKEAKEQAHETLEEDEKEISEEPEVSKKKNAFTVMKERRLEKNKADKKGKGKGKSTAAPLAAKQAAAATQGKRKKQALITDVVQNGKKKAKKQAKGSSSTEEEDDEGEK